MKYTIILFREKFIKIIEKVVFFLQSCGNILGIIKPCRLVEIIRRG